MSEKFVIDYDLEELEEENEQLQKENKRLKERNDELEDELEESSAFIIEQREENKQLKKSEKINMEYAEQIVEENQKLRIAKNDLRIENEQLLLAIDDLLSHTSCDEIKKENEQLREKVKDYEVILRIANSNDVLCKYQEIDDIAYYCDRYKDYRCYPLCREDKSCFKTDKTFQGKLEDLKEFWGERWYE